jgi:hypothetical protein
MDLNKRLTHTVFPITCYRGVRVSAVFEISISGMESPQLDRHKIVYYLVILSERQYA